MAEGTQNTRSPATSSWDEPPLDRSEPSVGQIMDRVHDIEEHTADSSANMSQLPQGRDWRLYNIVMVGISFMLMFTAFQTGAMTEVKYTQQQNSITTGYGIY